MTGLVALLLVVAVAILPPPPDLRVVVGGKITYAETGELEGSMWVRNLPPCPECVGYIAFLRCEGWLGRKVWLEPIGAPLFGPLYVVDCAGPGRRPERWLAEVDAKTARLLGFYRVAPIFASLWVSPPERRVDGG